MACFVINRAYKVDTSPEMSCIITTPRLKTLVYPLHDYCQSFLFFDEKSLNLDMTGFCCHVNSFNRKSISVLTRSDRSSAIKLRYENMHAPEAKYEVTVFYIVFAPQYFCTENLRVL